MTSLYPESSCYLRVVIFGGGKHTIPPVRAGARGLTHMGTTMTTWRDGTDTASLSVSGCASGFAYDCGVPSLLWDS